VAAVSARRVSLQDPGVVDGLCALLEVGVPLKAACASMGVGRSTVYDAMQADEELAVRIGDARAKWEADAVRTIASAGRDDWKAMAWLLERGKPDKWAPTKRIENTGKGGGPMEVRDVTLPTEPTARAELRATLIERARALTAKLEGGE